MSSPSGPKLDHIRVVLARPSEPRNIGATCRAIRNFGITRLTIVTDRQVDYEAARPLAAGAVDVLEAAQVVASLPEAVRGSTVVAGITRRLGQKRKAVSFTPWRFAERFAARPDAGGDATVCVVFGNEQSGLSDEELEHCHVAVSIPTDPGCPSMNLSHAVAIIAYEVSKAAREAAGPRRGGLTVDETDEAAGSIVGSLKELGFHSQDGPQGMHLFMRDLIARAAFAPSEARRFVALFTKLAGMHGLRPPSG